MPCMPLPNHSRQCRRADLNPPGFGAGIVMMLALAAAVLTPGRMARAMNQPSYNLDSLVFMAHHIVAGKVLTAKGDNATVKITESFDHTLSAGDEVTVATLSFYAVVDKGNHPFFHGRAIKPGERFYFFLIKAKKRFLFNPPPNSMMTVPSGLKLIADDGVYGFHQVNNPGPYIAGPGANMKPIPLDRFKQRLAASIQRVEPIRAVFDQPAGPDQVPHLLALLKQRAKSYDKNAGFDAIAGAVAKRVAGFDQPEAAYEVTRIVSTSMRGSLQFQASVALAGAFATPAGHALWLEKMGDPDTPRPTRLALAGDLWQMGMSDAPAPDNAPGSADHVADTAGGEQPDATNHHFMKRIAGVAVAAAGDKDMFEELMRFWDFQIRSYTNPNASTDAQRDPAVRRDLRDADAVLASFAKSKLTDWQRVQVDQVRKSIAAFLKPATPNEKRNTTDAS